jgi:hypothetical protein
MQSEFKGTLSSHPRSSSRLPTSDHQSVETSGTDGSERKARVEVFSAHFAESCTGELTATGDMERNTLNRATRA